MEIISPNRKGKFVYDKFNSKAFNADDLLIINQFHKTDFYFLTLQQYEVSGEWIVWISCDLFAEIQFDDVWLIFSRTEKMKAQEVFSLLQEKLIHLENSKTPKQFRQIFSTVLDEIEQQNESRVLPVTA